jgi:hypothetical protein
MKTLIKNITFDSFNVDSTDINFKFNTINQDKILKYIETSQISTSPQISTSFTILSIQQTFTDVTDIKNFNDRDKLILSLFINQYVNLNPTISTHSKYYDYLKKPIQMLNKKNLTRGYYICNDVIVKSNLNLTHNKVLNISKLPTFIESYINICKNKPAKIDYVNIVSTYPTKSIQPTKSTQPTKQQTLDAIYTKLLNDFTQTYPELNSITKINFYERQISELLIDNKLQEKYDLIMFDTYKNIFEFDEVLLILEEYPKLNTNNINRFVSSIIHAKSLLHQIIFAINKLNINGDLILLFSGFDTNASSELIFLLSSLFDKITLIHSDKDYSFRYYVVCKQFNGKNQIIDKINEIYKLFENENNQSNILLNIIDAKLTKKINCTCTNKFFISNELINKFITISNKINKITNFINNGKLITKMYDHIYFIQLFNSYKTLKQSFDIDKINDKVIVKLNNYKKKLFDKLLVPYNYNFNIESSNIKKFKFIFDTLNDEQFADIISSTKYLKLFDLIVFTNYYNKDKFDNIQNKIIFSQKKLDHEYYLYEIRKYLQSRNINTKIANIKITDANLLINKIVNIFNDYKDNNNHTTIDDYIIIKFNLCNLCPFFVSVIYVLLNIYNNSAIIKTKSYSGVFFFIVSNKISNIENSTNVVSFMDKYNEFYKANKNMTSLKDMFLVQLDDNFINTLNAIILKLILKELILSIKLKFICNGEQFTQSFYDYIKQSKITERIYNEWKNEYNEYNEYNN